MRDAQTRVRLESPDMARKPRKARLQDIATRAKLSVPTVSMALANHPRVSRRTKRVVWQISEELGYRAGSPGARGLRPGSSKIGFAIPGNSSQSPANQAMMMYFTRLASRMDVSIEMLSNEETTSPSDIARRVERFVEKLDGLILTGMVHRETVEAVRAHDVPLVILGDPLEGVVADYVTYDGEGAGRRATKFLLDKGHRKIAFLREFVAPGSATARWYDGYRLALLDAGIVPRPELSAVVDPYREPVPPTVERLLDLRDPPDAFVVPNPFIASPLLDVLRTRKRDMPMCTLEMRESGIPNLLQVPSIIVSVEALCQYTFRRLLYLCQGAVELPLRTIVPFETHLM
jgi:LacI family transcriptional regulator